MRGNSKGGKYIRAEAKKHFALLASAAFIIKEAAVDAVIMPDTAAKGGKRKKSDTDLVSC